MPELEFTLDPETGALEMHVKGMTGPACEDFAKLARELLGPPSHEDRTADYYVRSEVRSQVRPARQ